MSTRNFELEKNKKNIRSRRALLVSSKRNNERNDVLAVVSYFTAYNLMKDLLCVQHKHKLVQSHHEVHRCGFFRSHG